MGLPAVSLAYLLGSLIILVVTAGAILWWVGSQRRIAAETVGRAQAEAERLTRQAEREADTLRKEAALEAREKAHADAAEAERQARVRREEILSLEQALGDKTRALADRLASSAKTEQELRAREQSLAQQEQAAAAARTKAEQLVAERQRELQRVAGLSADEARELLFKQIETDARRDAANLVKRLETEARETAGVRAQQIIIDAIQRSAAEHAIETTVSVVDLPSDDLKGRIIGREGRNIRALETATGVELIVDDTPGAIILSSFDPFRREVARQAIERLIADGRIHPARIEEVVEKVKAEMEESVRKEGEAAAFELGLYDLPSGNPAADGPAEVPHQLRAERAQPLEGGRVPRRHHGEGARPERRMSPRAPRSSTTSARRSIAICRARISNSASTSSASTARASRCCRPSPRTTWTSTGRRSRR